MDGFSTWASQFWVASQPTLNWFGGPFWTFINAPFIAGLIPALVGLLLSKRVAEVAETNKNVEAVRAAEAQVHDIDRAQEAFELRTTVSEIPAPQPGPGPQPAAPAPAPTEIASLPNQVVAELEEKIDAIKVELRHRVSELDGRRARKYENVSFYDYRPIVLMLARDGAISDENAYTLVEIFSVWMNHRLNKPMLPQDKANLILGFRLPRKHKRSNSQNGRSTSEAAASNSAVPIDGSSEASAIQE